MTATQLTTTRLGSRPGRNSFGFWVVAFAFATAMAFTTVPMPLTRVGVDAWGSAATG
jgi:hypothetical protein